MRAEYPDQLDYSGRMRFFTKTIEVLNTDPIFFLVQWVGSHTDFAFPLIAIRNFRLDGVAKELSNQPEQT